MKKYNTPGRGGLQSAADGEAVILDPPENTTADHGSVSGKMQIDRLTSREMDVLQLVAKGKLNKQAASELHISIKTVEKHRENIVKKLGIRGIAGLTHFAIHAGITPCDPWMAME